MSKADMSFPLVKVYTSKKLPPPIYKKIKISLCLCKLVRYKLFGAATYIYDLYIRDAPGQKIK
jgi:hypothetical protein